MKIIVLSPDPQADPLWDFVARHGTPIPARTISEVLAHLPQASTAVLVRATAVDSGLIRLLCQFPEKGIIAPVVVVATMTDGLEALRASNEAARAGLATFIHSTESVPALLAALQPPYHDLMQEVLTAFGIVGPEVRRIIQWLADGGQPADCDEFAASLGMARRRLRRVLRDARMPPPGRWRSLFVLLPAIRVLQQNGCIETAASAAGLADERSLRRSLRRHFDLCVGDVRRTPTTAAIVRAWRKRQGGEHV